jgi:uncharacterized membrane protein
VEFRLGVVAPLAILLQAAAIAAPLGDDDAPRRILLQLSYVFLCAFVLANIWRPGIALIGVGLLFNFAAIVANGGLMPITPETLLQTGPLPDGAAIGRWLPGTKDVLLEREDVHLYFFSDRIVWQDISSVIRAFSIGDVVIMSGLFVTLAELFVPRIETKRQDGGVAGSLESA